MKLHNYHLDLVKVMKKHGINVDARDIYINYIEDYPQKAIVAVTHWEFDSEIITAATQYAKSIVQEAYIIETVKDFFLRTVEKFTDSEYEAGLLWTIIHTNPEPWYDTHTDQINREPFYDFLSHTAGLIMDYREEIVR